MQSGHQDADDNDPDGSAALYCRGCGLLLEERRDSMVVQFGDGYYHPACFSCNRCGSAVEHDTNLLLLSDGSPICEKCSYVCNVCKKMIDTEAIVTGEDSYHADCFRCFQCREKIQELIFARTKNDAIYCMTCHNGRVARSRKAAEAKRKQSIKRSNGSTKHSSTRSASDNAIKSPHNGQDLSAAPSPIIADSSQNTPVVASATFLSHSTNTPRPKLGSRTTSSSSRKASSTAGRESPALASSLHNSPRPSISTEGRRSPALQAQLDEADAAFQGLGFENLSSSTATKRLAPSSRGDKAANRRSGFYGVMATPSAQNLRSALEPMLEADSSSNSIHLQSPPHSPPIIREPPSSDTPRSSGVRESFDFNHNDVLAMLEAADNPGQLNRNSMLLPTSPMQIDPRKSRPVSLPPSPARSVHDIQLSPPSPPKPISMHESGPQSPDLSTSDEQAFLAARRHDHDDSDIEKSDTVREARESIRKSRDMKDNGFTINVDLVENLLEELQDTKEQMKELQKNYNAMRRASRQAFEGFSLASQDFEREVSARRDAEAQMTKLKQQLREQAAKLGAIDAANRNTEHLQRKSKSLRTTVDGMQKHLSLLKAERDITVAEVEELVAMRQSSSSRGTTASSVEHVTESLRTRLDSLKDVHRKDLESLANEKDALLQEVEELRSTREIFAEEAASLNLRNTELAEQNNELQKQLDEAREALLRVQQQAFALGPKGHHKVASSLTGSLNGSLSMSRNSSPSQSFDSPPDGGLMQVQKIESVGAPAVRKFKWGKKQSDRPGATPLSRPTHKVTASADVTTRMHSFQATSILRPVRCEHCGDKMWGLQELRCAACGLYCHSRCVNHYNVLCNAAITDDYSDTMNLTMMGHDLISQSQIESRSVPIIVTKCIEAVEAMGMEYEGIYRKSGGMSQTKYITSCFDRGDTFDLTDTDRFNDISAITSVLKNYFRQLPIPLFTFDLHEEFCATGERDEPLQTRLDRVARLLPRMPEVHYNTLQTLMMHLHNVHLNSESNKMTPANLGVVFGPTLLRSPDASQEFAQMHLKARTVELCVEYAPILFGIQMSRSRSDSMTRSSSS